MSRQAHIPGQMGLFRPSSQWKPPTELPDLRGRPIVAIDSETRDLGLEQNRGPGWPFGQGYCRLLGISWAAEGSVGYAPVGHPDTSNFPLPNVMRWLDDLFKSGTRIVMHNGPYDIGVFGTYGVVPPPNLEDTLAAAVMLDESQGIYKPGTTPFSLDNSCARYGIAGKDTDLLKEAVRAYGGNPNKAVADLWRVPARYGAPYAEQDGVATLELWQHQEPQLRAQEVWEAYRTEIELIPMVVAMRRRGIRIDSAMLERTQKEFLSRRDALLKRVSEQAGSRRIMTIGDMRSPQFLEKLFTQENIPFPRTEKTKQGSFSSDWMEKYDHWLPRALVDIIKYEDAANKFLGTYLTGYAHRGRIHAEVHQFRSDDGGTKSHRFSYSEPPLQQMPSPDKDPVDENKKVLLDRATGTLIRRCFLPESGDGWGSVDFSSQEPRMVVHFASLCKCPGADEAVRQYSENPRLDYHAMVAELTGLPRARAKILNLAVLYGYGKASMAAHLGVNMREAEELTRQYHERLPFIKPFEEKCKGTAGNRGYIRLIDGARIRYQLWEGPYLSAEERLEAHKLGHVTTYCSREEAMRRQQDPAHPWAGKALRRADTRKGLNHLIQGSAARQTKIAMKMMWAEGILPLLQLHDEVAVSVGTEAELNRVAQIMVEATPLRVPTVVDAEIGPTWGDAKMSWAQYAARYRDAA